MLLKRAFLSLPTSLLLLVLAQAQDIHERLQQQQQPIPLAVRKMALDDSEKFFPEQYYGFEATGDEADYVPANNRNAGNGKSLASLFSFGRRFPSIAPSDGGRERQAGRWPLAVRSDPSSSQAPPTRNDSTIALAFSQAYLPPFSLHHENEDYLGDGSTADTTAAWELFRRAADALARLQSRQWGCPGGTTSCESIGYPYSCCQNGETCYKVTNTGLGPVGCCPSGTTCGGSVSSCGSGSTACPSSLGGGCCISGYVCEGVGCVPSASTATTATTSTTTSTAVASTGQPSTVVVTVVVTETPGGGVTTRTTTITSTPGTSTTSTATTSGGGVAPGRPTLTTTLTSSSSLPSGFCPTGYYACVASAGGGCCQTGRDCHTTGCPAPPASSTIVNSNGLTVVVPATAAAAATSTGTCASGWFLCPASAGPVAGCCPNGYDCGTASCTLVSASATGEVQKELPGNAGSRVAPAGVVSWLSVALSLGFLIFR